MKHSLIVLMTLLMSALASQAQVIVDLSDDLVIEEAITTKHTSIEIKNMMPTERQDGKYSVNIQLASEEIPPLTNSAIAGDVCDLNLLTLLKNVDNEDKVRDAVNALQNEMETNKSLKPQCLEAILDEIKETTYTVKLQFALKENQTLTVTVIRKDEKGEVKKSWKKIFRTPTRSPWLTHFGFTFQPNIISRPRQYFSSVNTEGEGFIVSERGGAYQDFWENLSPTIMFTYQPKEGNSQLGFSAIASTNFNNFSAGPGLSYVIGKNVAVGAGIMFTQKYHLRGEYRNGQVITENLNFEQLHEKRWGPEMFFTIGLRFDKNPFSGGEKLNNEAGSEKSTEKKDK